MDGGGVSFVLGFMLEQVLQRTADAGRHVSTTVLLGSPLEREFSAAVSTGLTRSAFTCIYLRVTSSRRHRRLSLASPPLLSSSWNRYSTTATPEPQ